MPTVTARCTGSGTGVSLAATHRSEFRSAAPPGNVGAEGGKSVLEVIWESDLMTTAGPSGVRRGRPGRWAMTSQLWAKRQLPNAPPAHSQAMKSRVGSECLPHDDAKNRCKKPRTGSQSRLAQNGRFGHERCATGIATRTPSLCLRPCYVTLRCVNTAVMMQSSPLAARRIMAGQK